MEISSKVEELLIFWETAKNLNQIRMDYLKNFKFRGEETFKKNKNSAEEYFQNEAF